MQKVDNTSEDKYSQAVDNLKQLLRNEKKYRTIFKLINNGGLIEDIDVKILADIVISERELILANFESELDNLSSLNKRLIQFTREPQPSINKAKKLLSTICINIYDIIACRIDKETDLSSLRKDLRKNIDRRFSLKMAKKYVNIACFLKRL
uniref:Uncharacterized protein n=1 Tax=viral metagenome TaxID=1070528 RepID=A0A6C0I175_9ZZZZ